MEVTDSTWERSLLRDIWQGGFLITFVHMGCLGSRDPVFWVYPALRDLVLERTGV